MHRGGIAWGRWHRPVGVHPVPLIPLLSPVPRLPNGVWSRKLLPGTAIPHPLISCSIPFPVAFDPGKLGPWGGRNYFRFSRLRYDNDRIRPRRVIDWEPEIEPEANPSTSEGWYRTRGKYAGANESLSVHFLEEVMPKLSFRRFH